MVVAITASPRVAASASALGTAAGSVPAGLSSSELVAAAATGTGAWKSSPALRAGSTRSRALHEMVYFSHTSRVMKGGSTTTASNVCRSSAGKPARESLVQAAKCAQLGDMRDTFRIIEIIEAKAWVAFPLLVKLHWVLQSLGPLRP